MVAPMLIQPYVENAVLHGLAKKEEQGMIIIKLKQVDKMLLCQVIDNGIGRKAAQMLKEAGQSMNKSVGMKITRERLGLLNKKTNAHLVVSIDDMYHDNEVPAGTLVTLQIPLTGP